AAVDRVVTRLLEPAALSPARPATGGREPRVGDRVIVGGFGLEGVVTNLHHDGSAEIDMRGKRMRASARDLSVVDHAGAGNHRQQGQAGNPGNPGNPGKPGNPGNNVTARVTVNVELQPRETTPSDLNVIGCTV